MYQLFFIIRIGYNYGNLVTLINYAYQELPLFVAEMHPHEIKRRHYICHLWLM